jgi:ABC-2 type transport system ATP-binding protein
VPANLAIVVKGLRKSYGSLEAVRGVDFDIHTGEIFALLGPNGAGKTTTVEILEGHRSRDAGEVSVLGYDPASNSLDLKRRIGIVLQTTGVQPYLTVEESIELFRGYYPDPLPLDDIIDAVGLNGKRKALVRRMSGGEQRRLDVAIGLAGNPELLFLDEPTTGFDPSARRNAWGMVKNLQSLGKTVVLTTHYMEEAQFLADRVAILVNGQIAVQGTPGSLTRMDATTRISFRLSPGLELPETMRVDARVEAGTVSFQTLEPTRMLHMLTSWAVQRGIELEQLVVSRTSLEDIYLELARDAEKEEPKA